MNKVRMPAIVATVLGLPLGGSALAAQESPLWGDLTAGPHAVGFRILDRLDRSRTWDTRALNSGSGEFARPIRISVWYPARPHRSRVPMRYRDYVHRKAPTAYFARLDDLLVRRDTSSLRRTFEGAQSHYDRLLTLRTMAGKDALPAAGRFPLVMYSQGWNSSSQHDNIVLAEYLASHGYVVASVPQVGESAADLTLRITQPDLETQMRDIEFAMGVAHQLPFVDRRKLAVMGWSMGGVVSLWIAGRNPNVDAVVGLDASFRWRDFVSLVLGSPYFDIRRLRAPILTLQTGNEKYLAGQDDRVVDSLHFADRFIGRVGRVTHGDFSDFAMIARLFPVTIIDRTADEASRGHEAVCRYVLAFLHGTMKNDSSALTLVRHGSVDTNARSVSVTMRHAVAAHVPSEEDFVALLEQEGLDRTVRRYHELRAQYPQLEVIRYAVLNRLGYRLLRERRPDLATEVFRLNAGAHPTLADAFDSLADGYLAKGDSVAARAAYERVLSVLPSDTTVAPSTRDELRRRAESGIRASRTPNE